MKILVTGSSGTIGTRLCERLLDAGHDVTGADWEPNKWQPHIDERTVRVDLRDESACGALPTDIDLIIHLAANARVYELVEHPDRAFDNMQSTFNVLEHARKNGIKKFIFASSRECYGNLDMDTLTEDLARVENCESPYTASKVAGEALIHSYHNCYDLDAVIIRFSNVYGAYDDSVRVVPLFIRLAEANEQITVFGRDKNLDFTYIDDACLGVECVIEHFDAAKGDTFNIAYGEGNTILRLAEYIKELKGSKSDIQVGESRTGEITHYVADTSKARTVLGFNPQIPFDDGVRQAVEWYSAHT